MPPPSTPLHTLSCAFLELHHYTDSNLESYETLAASIQKEIDRISSCGHSSYASFKTAELFLSHLFLETSHLFLETSQASYIENHLAIMDLLLGMGANINAKSETGNTALHYACYAGINYMARYLIDHSADVMALDEELSTPLHDSTTFGSVEVAHMLIEAGADLNARNQHGYTPLELVSQPPTTSSTSSHDLTARRNMLHFLTAVTEQRTLDTDLGTASPHPMRPSHQTRRM